MDREKIVQKLFKRRIITEKGCWEFPVTSWRHPYGVVRVGLKNWETHRLSFSLFKPDEFNEYLYVLHKCNNKKCFNPDHLYSGTASQNTLDSVRAGTHYEASQTHCIHGHEFTTENTYVEKKTGKRHCKICMKIRDSVKFMQDLT